MFANPALIIYISAIILASLVLFGLIFLYSFYLGKVAQKDTDSYQRAKEIVDEANSKAVKMLEEATQKSTQLISQIESAKLTLDSKVDERLKLAVDNGIKALEQASSGIAANYKDIFESVRANVLKEVDGTLVKVREAGEQTLVIFRSSLKDQQTSSQYYLGKRINQEFDLAQKEVEKYKADQIRLVEENIDHLILRLSQEILGKAISLEQHEKLIYQALNKAKDEGFFNK